MQPLVGVWSDHCKSRFGRRRPFIVGGSFVILVALSMISYCRELAVSLQNTLHGRGLDIKETQQDEPDGWLAVAMVIAGFFVLDFAINVVQAASRALIIDRLAVQD